MNTHKLILAAVWCLALMAGTTVASGTAEAVSLVTPQGGPVGGSWQRWANEAKVPTVNATVVMMPASFCDIPGVAQASGCSNTTPPWALYASGHDVLYFELGHIFDANRLTWSERGQFAHVWGVYGHPWADSTKALMAGQEDGLMVDFAAAYESCALGWHSGGLQAGEAPTIQMGNTCALIRSA